MTLHLTLDNDATKIWIRPNYGINNVTLNCDITPLLKLLYNNNLHTHKAMSTMSTKYKLPKYELYTNYYKIKKLPTYQLNILSCSGSQLQYSPSLGCLPL